jgi:hypothetical protein
MSSEEGRAVRERLLDLAIPPASAWTLRVTGGFGIYGVRSCTYFVATTVAMHKMWRLSEV